MMIGRCRGEPPTGRVLIKDERPGLTGLSIRECQVFAALLHDLAMQCEIKTIALDVLGHAQPDGQIDDL